MTIHLHPLALALAGALALTGCGGGSDDGDSQNGGGENGATSTVSQFSEARELSIPLPANGASVCYDLKTNPASVVQDCGSSTAWDLKVTGAGLYPTLWTNSGISGPGKGGAFGGPFSHTWASLETYQRGNVDPASGATLPATVYTADAVGSVFSGSGDSGSRAFEYGLGGDHNLYPNFRVFLITTDSASASVTAGVYALQIINYYSAAGASGHPTLRWMARDGSESVPREKTYNATLGWVYIDLSTGLETTEDGGWHIALNRLQVRLNGGVNNPNGKVAGFEAYTPPGFYDAEGQPLAEAFKNPPPAATTAAYLSAADLSTPTRPSAWVQDSNGSALNPAYRGTYNVTPFDFGWFNYYPSAALAESVGLLAHQLKANPDNASLIRTGDGKGYVRLHLKDIRYADPSDARSVTTWTYGYAVQTAQ